MAEAGGRDSDGDGISDIGKYFLDRSPKAVWISKTETTFLV